IILTDKNNSFEETDIVCEKCGSKMVIKHSRFGEILTCPRYPECKNLKNFIRNKDNKIVIIENDKPLDEKCPDCGDELLLKKGKNGLFVGCKNYPNCKFTANYTIKDGKIMIKEKPKTEKVQCEKCGKDMVLKRSRRGPFFACSGYPKCKTTLPAMTKEDGTIAPKK
ncbi:MAG: topoisomerase DNA-binding C4 zinc finger domain-containing protein, partial [Deferribacterales bacterium]